MSFEPHCQAWKPLVDLERPWRDLGETAMIFSQIKRSCLDPVSRGSALDSADLGPVPVLCLLPMSCWARRLHSLGIGFLIFEVGTIILRFLPEWVEKLQVIVSNTIWYMGSTTHSLTKITLFTEFGLDCYPEVPLPCGRIIFVL